MFEKIRYNLKKRFFRTIALGWDVTLEELKEKQINGAEIIDVRGQREFEEGHIEGSINIPEYEINNNFENIIKNKNKPIVLYCATGFRSTKAYYKLKDMGYTEVYNLYGGIENYWEKSSSSIELFYNLW